MTWLDSILMIIVWILLIVANEYLAAEWIGKISLSSTEGELCVSVLCQSAFHMNGSCNLQKQHQRYIFFIGPHRRGGPLNLSGPYTVKQIVQQSDAQRCVAQVTEPFTMQLGLVQRPKSAIFSLSTCGWMDGWMDVIVFFAHDFFHTVAPIVMKLKTDH